MLLKLEIYRVNEDVDLVKAFDDLLVLVVQVSGDLADNGDVIVGVAVPLHEVLVHQQQPFGGETSKR